VLNFTPPKAIKLRDYQAAAVEALRAGIRAGKKRQILVAGTGAGKTLTSAHILAEAAAKGSYTLFVVDRIALVDQTSAVFEEYGIPHGVVQGDHRRWAPRENVQVCSAQTLARRSLPRDPALIIVDECHAQYRATLDFMNRNPAAVCIGLTATPFTPGMGKHWSGVVNVIPTRKLIEGGYLTEPKIYVARSPQDADLGLNSYGEFSDASATSAGIQIIGDVVTEWVTKTREHFGGPAKTIVFSPTVEHGRELCAAFAAAGYNFQQISYLDRSDEERAEKIAEFRRPDSIIHGLVSCGVLTKGFDVPDVACIASGQRVLTDKGLVPIEKVTLDHRLWDGIEYVSHQGVIFKGYQDVIEYAGIVATPDHEVHTPQGWRPLGDCAAEQVGITQTGFGECPVRWDAGYLAGDHLAEEGALGSRACAMRMRWLRRTIGQAPFDAAIKAARAWVPPLLSRRDERKERRSSGLAGSQGEGHEGALREAVAQGVAGLWRARDRVSLFFASILRGVGCSEPWPAEAGPQCPVGSSGQRWALRAWKSPLGIKGAQLQQHAARWLGGDDASLPHGAPRDPLCGQDPAESVRDGDDLRASGGAVLPALRQAKRPVWDILQAGPRNRFTCEGLLVHNCGISCKPYRKSLSSHMQEIGRVMRTHPSTPKKIWLCHSGNVERFALDMFDVWENGAGELSHAEKQDSKPRERNAEERQKVVCPQCSGALRGNTCMACGWEKPARSGVHAVDGEMVEFSLAQAMEPRAGLRADCLRDPRAVYEAALAYAFAHGRDEAKGRKRAYAIWRGVYPTSKPVFGWYDMPAPTQFDPTAYALVEREVRRFRKTRRAA
jgi:superfamily II DNA or RNA helicase